MPTEPCPAAKALPAAITVETSDVVEKVANNFADYNHDFESDSEDEDEDEGKHGFLADRFVPDPGQSKLTTLTKSKKKLIKVGDQQSQPQEKAMWSALSGHRPTSCAKLLFVIASCMIDKVASIG